jgi:hypothetical protein
VAGSPQGWALRAAAPNRLGQFPQVGYFRGMTIPDPAGARIVSVNIGGQAGG